MASTIYMGLLFGSYRGTVVPLEVSWYRSMTRKVHPYMKDEMVCNRLRMCNQVLGVQPGSWCATRFRVCNQVYGVQPGSRCETRFMVCNQVQGVDIGIWAWFAGTTAVP